MVSRSPARRRPERAAAGDGPDHHRHRAVELELEPDTHEAVGEGGHHLLALTAQTLTRAAMRMMRRMHVGAIGGRVTSRHFFLKCSTKRKRTFSARAQ